MQGRARIRPFASIWRLALRVGLIVGLTSMVLNAVFWFSTLWRTCEFVCARDVREAIVLTLKSGGLWSAVLVPLLTLLLTPMIHFGAKRMSGRIGPTRSIIVMSLVAILATACLIFVTFFVLGGMSGSVWEYASLFLAVLGVVGVSAVLFGTVVWATSRWARRQR